MKKNKVIIMALILVLLLSLVGCGSNESSNSEEDKTIVIGSRAGGTSLEIIELIKPELEAEGYTVDIKTFSDFNTPNEALNDGDLDFNFYQHEGFLNEYNKNKGTDLVKVGSPIYTMVWGIYSTKIDSLDELKDGATVSIFNDTSNRNLCLRILESEGLIKLDQDKENLLVTDIIENPKNLKFVELEGPALFAAIKDVDIAVATAFNVKDALGSLDSTLATHIDENLGWVLAAKKGNEDTDKAKAVHEALTSQKVRDYLEIDNEGTLTALFQ